MQKEEVISELVNLKLQIAQLKLQEKALYEKLDVVHNAMPKEKVRVELFKVLPPAIPVKKPRKKMSYYTRQKLSTKIKQYWSTVSPEKRAAHVAKIGRRKKDGTA